MRDTSPDHRRDPPGQTRLQAPKKRPFKLGDWILTGSIVVGGCFWGRRHRNSARVLWRGVRSATPKRRHNGRVRFMLNWWEKHLFRSGRPAASRGNALFATPASMTEKRGNFPPREWRANPVTGRLSTTTL